MASMRDIKRRKESIQSTGQITKAMKLVATVKLQKAKSRAEALRPYFKMTYQTVVSILEKSGHVSHPFLVGGGSEKKAVILITSNRGLAGGYNANMVKLVTQGDFSSEDTLVYAVGRKGRDFLRRRDFSIQKDYSDSVNDPLFSDAVQIGKEVLEAFVKGEVGEIYLAFTDFRNTVSHDPTLLRLLPIDRESLQEGGGVEEEDPIEKFTLMNYEPDEDEAIERIIPKYINSLIYGALIQAVASENGARMQAMDSATKNAEEMIDDLSLKFNRARQGSITQEITEIVAGASAIS